MTVAHLTFEKLKEILKENGWDVASNDFFLDYNRIIFEKTMEDGKRENIVVQYRKMYTFLFVVPFFESLGITPPQDCLTNYEELSDYRKKKKGENGKKK